MHLSPITIRNGIALALFVGAMWVLGQALEWGVDQLPLPVAACLAGAIAGLCSGYFIGEREGRAIERRRASGLEQ